MRFGRDLNCASSATYLQQIINLLTPHCRALGRVVRINIESFWIMFGVHLGLNDFGLFLFSQVAVLAVGHFQELDHIGCSTSVSDAGPHGSE